MFYGFFHSDTEITELIQSWIIQFIGNNLVTLYDSMYSLTWRNISFQQIEFNNCNYLICFIRKWTIVDLI